ARACDEPLVSLDGSGHLQRINEAPAVFMQPLLRRAAADREEKFLRCAARKVDEALELAALMAIHPPAVLEVFPGSPVHHGTDGKHASRRRRIPQTRADDGARGDPASARRRYCAIGHAHPRAIAKQSLVMPYLRP